MLCGDLSGKEIQKRGDISIHPTLVFLPGTSHGQGKLVGYSPRGHRVDTCTRKTDPPCCSAETNTKV